MNNIRVFRETAGLNQTELASLIGISSKTIARYETGLREPRSSDLLRIAKVLGCTTDDLIGNPTEAPARRRRTTGASTRSAA